MNGRAQSSRFGFAVSACAMVAVFAASASPIPLYDIYRRAEGLPKSDLALTAVVYFVAVMSALLTLGRLSNHLGRRPVSIAALLITAAGTLVLTSVHSAWPLVGGRALQGIGCGLAASALAAYIVDSAPVAPVWLGSAATTGAPMVGLTLGALGSGALAQYGPAPRTLIYLLCAATLVLCALLLAAGRETVSRTPGAVASLRPQVRIPRRARRLLPAAAATFVATWALGGFYQAFGPTVTADQLGTRNPLVAAIVFASLMAPSAIGAPFAGRTTPARAQRLGMAAFLGGVILILISLRLGVVESFLAGSLLAGAAQGTTFAASMRALLAEGSAADRAGILAAIYLLSYSGAAIPGFVAGQLAASVSLYDIGLGYGVLAALGFAITFLTAREPALAQTDPQAIDDRDLPRYTTAA